MDPLNYNEKQPVSYTMELEIFEENHVNDFNFDYPDNCSYSCFKCCQCTISRIAIKTFTTIAMPFAGCAGCIKNATIFEPRASLFELTNGLFNFICCPCRSIYPGCLCALYQQRYTLSNLSNSEGWLLEHANILSQTNNLNNYLLYPSFGESDIKYKNLVYSSFNKKGEFSHARLFEIFIKSNDTNFLNFYCKSYAKDFNIILHANEFVKKTLYEILKKNEDLIFDLINNGLTREIYYSSIKRDDADKFLKKIEDKMKKYLEFYVNKAIKVVVLSNIILEYYPPKVFQFDEAQNKFNYTSKIYFLSPKPEIMQ